MANHVQIVALDTIISNQKNMATLQQKYKEQHGEEKTGPALQARIRKAYNEIQGNNDINRGNQFYDALRAMMFPRQEEPEKKPPERRESPRREEKQVRREAPPAPVPAKVAVETEKLIKPFQDGDLPKLLEDSKIKENPIGGDYTRKNAALDQGRVRAVQMMVNNFIRLHLDNNDTTFFAALDSHWKGTRPLLNGIMESDFVSDPTDELKGRLKKDEREKLQAVYNAFYSKEYTKETAEIVKSIQRYLNYYYKEAEDGRLTESDVPGSRFKEAMDKFNAYLKTGKIPETGIVDAQTLGAIAIYVALAKGKTIEIPAVKGAPTVIEPAATTAPPSTTGEKLIKPDFPIY